MKYKKFLALSIVATISLGANAQWSDKMESQLNNFVDCPMPIASMDSDDTRVQPKFYWDSPETMELPTAMPIASEASVPKFIYNQEQIDERISLMLNRNDNYRNVIKKPKY